MSKHSQELRYLAPAALRPDPLNARTHSAAQIKQIVASIAKFGFVGAILADENLNVIAGHGRIIAAQQCDLPLVPVFKSLTSATLSGALWRSPTIRSRSTPDGMPISCDKIWSLWRLKSISN